MCFIVNIDNFILNNKPTDDKLYISFKDLVKGKNLFNKIKVDSGTKYKQFGSENYGSITYSLYKSQSQNIYLIVKKMCFISGYLLIEDDSWFL